MLFRGMLDAMDGWVSEGRAPPASRIPMRSDGSLATMEEWLKQFPNLPGFLTPRGPAPLPLLDWGPNTEQGILAEPPQKVGEQYYTALVPSVDKDGNDVAGVRAPMVAAPLATYTGWNIRAHGQGYGAMHEFTGTTRPFPDTEVERQRTGDPRVSIAERYGECSRLCCRDPQGRADPRRRAIDAGGRRRPLRGRRFQLGSTTSMMFR